MATRTAIEWADVTWNPVTGCRKVSPGCDHCYAAALARRLKAMGNPRYTTDGPDGPGFGLALHQDKVREPLRWRHPRRVFVNSMSDLFHKDVPEAFIRDVFATMREARQHQFQVLTKRPRRMRGVVGRIVREHGVAPNVWLGASVENDDYTWRADHVRRVPAAVRYLSLEPLLGPLRTLDLTGIDWVIVGGESGPQARPCDPGWVRDLRERAAKAGTAFFFKQWGGRTSKSGGRQLDGRTWDEYPRRRVGGSVWESNPPRTA